MDSIAANLPEQISTVAPENEVKKGPSANRNLDHLQYSENLFDFMKSLIPFSITTTNKSVNAYLLNGDSGLEKNEFLNIYYNDGVGKRELL